MFDPTLKDETITSWTSWVLSMVGFKIFFADNPIPRCLLSFAFSIKSNVGIPESIIFPLPASVAKAKILSEK